ncbi:hypothetical protein BGZ65_012427, partial [Modicella reniformis]
GFDALALHNAGTSIPSLGYPGLATPSARLSDDTIERLNLSLPFERFLGSSASASSRSTPNASNVQLTPIKSRPVLVDKIATPPNSGISQRVAHQGPHCGNVPQFQTDEENNLFLAQSPRAIRTPRKNRDRTDSCSPLTPSEQPVPLPELLASEEDQTTETDLPRPSNPSGDMVIPDEDDVVETESVQSSTGGDTEKENRTPKLSHDLANPFYVGSTSGSDWKRQLRSVAKGDGSTTPTGPPSIAGHITRSRRHALGSISPWRWNTFDDQVALSTF